MARGSKTWRFIRRRLYFGLGIYLALPLAAGFFSVGNKLGPKIYPVGLHTALYTIGWEMNGSPERQRHGKPRVGFWCERADRPWFYGLPAGPSFQYTP